MCQQRFTSGNKCTPLLWDVGYGEGCVCVRGQNLYGNSVLIIQCCCEPATALKSRVYFEERGG